MKQIIILLVLLSQNLFSQKLDRVKLNFPTNEELKTENVISLYNQFNFSNIWIKTNNNRVLGIIGEEHQRIQIKLNSVQKDSNNPNKYYVSGKSCVKGTICDFSGTINLIEIKEVKKLHFGIDNEYADKEIKSQGIIVADYEFKENSDQKHSGVFKGKLYSKWYLNSKNDIKYDNIEFHSNGYINNAFVGTWKSYLTKKEKICTWGDYRVPLANKDFDIGAGEFSVTEKYLKKGWAEIMIKNIEVQSNDKAKKPNEWWK